MKKTGESTGSGMLARVAAERPRLIATKSAIARTQALLQCNPTLRQWQGEIARLGDLMLTLPPLTPNSVLDPRETEATPLPLVRPAPSSDAGPASRLEIARRFCLRIQTLGITWLLAGDPRYRDRAIAELLAMCAFPEWAGDEFLVTAETAFGAAIGYDWLYDGLTDAERELVGRAIIDKAIQPGLNQFALFPPPPQRWVTASTNWNLVCNGALMTAALSLGDFDPRAAELFAQCHASVYAGFDGYRPDGGWVEGPGYWHYATQYAIYLLDGLATALGTDLGFDAAPGLAQTGYFRLHAAGPSGKLFNFADSEEKHSGGYWLFWLARRYHHPVDASIELHRGKVHPMDLLWFDDNERHPSGVPTAKWFRGAEVTMLRGGWDRADTYLGIKGGANDSCRHAHYDLGSFVLDTGGTRWAVDLGPDDYSLPGYFTREKSRYYRTGTIGHNTLVIDGECQPPTADASFIRSSFRTRTALAVLDLSEAYPGTARVLRGFALIDRRHVLIVDEIVPDGALSSVDWQMHTKAEIELGDPVVTLTHPAQGDGAEPTRCYLRVIEPGPGSGSLSRVPATPTGPPGQNLNADTAKLVLHLEKVARPMRLAVLLSPDRAACATPRLPAALRRPLMQWAQPSGRARPR